MSGSTAAVNAAMNMMNQWYNANQQQNGRIAATTNLITTAATENRLAIWSPLAGAGANSWTGITTNKLPSMVGRGAQSLVDLIDLEAATAQQRTQDANKYVPWAFLQALQLKNPPCPYVMAIIEGPNRGHIRELFVVYANVNMVTQSVTSYVPVVKFNYNWNTRRYVMRQITSTPDVTYHEQYHG